MSISNNNNNNNNLINLNQVPLSNPPHSLFQRVSQVFGRAWTWVKKCSNYLSAIFRVHQTALKSFDKNSKNEEKNDVDSLQSQVLTANRHPDEGFDPINWDYFRLINVEGKGDCQILAFMEGLAKNHPKLLHAEKGRTLTPVEVRKKLIDFIRSKIVDPTTEESQLYLIALEVALEEHNDAVENQNNENSFGEGENYFKNQRQNLEEEKSSWKTMLSLAMIDGETYREKLAEIDAKIEELQKLEEPVVERLNLTHLDTVEDYLNYLSQPRSYCPHITLKALSELFKVPLCIHIIQNTGEETLQEFNSNKYLTDKIDLHFSAAEKHYQLRMYSED